MAPAQPAPASRIMIILDALKKNPADGGAWDSKKVHQVFLENDANQSLRSTERWLEAAKWLPAPLKMSELVDEEHRSLKALVVDSLQERMKRKRMSSWILQLHDGELGPVISVNDGRLSRQWLLLEHPLDSEPSDTEVRQALAKLAANKTVMVWPQGNALAFMRRWGAERGGHTIDVNEATRIESALTAFHQPKALSGAAVIGVNSADGGSASGASSSLGSMPSAGSVPSSDADAISVQVPGISAGGSLSHLDRLEAESIHIIREVVAQAENPVMLYSIGKDSSVMLHLARKAFYPSPPPFPLMHVDTRWKFQAMYDFRDHMARESGMDLIVHINPEGAAQDINPFDHGSALHTDVMKPKGLSKRWINTSLMSPSAVRVVTKKKVAQRNGSFPFATRVTVGIQKTNAQNCGICTTAIKNQARAFAYFRCLIGRNLISGNTFIESRSRSPRCILRRSGPWLNATVC